jgi:DNA ligase-associated metallophosphoesterase
LKSLANTIVSKRIADEMINLHAEKAIHLPEHDMLLIADLHFGKVEHFRKNGIAIPCGPSEKDFDILKSLVLKVQATNVVFLGDLFHSDFNNSWYKFQDLIEELNQFCFHLVIGNHDIMDISKYNNLSLHYQLDVGNLILTHEPLDVIIEDKYNICGHIHPGVKLKGKGKQYLRMPCFYFGKHMGILPAFGSFTGLHVLKPLEEDDVYVVNGDLVVKVN